MTSGATPRGAIPAGHWAFASDDSLAPAQRQPLTSILTTVRRPAALAPTLARRLLPTTYV